MHKCCYIAVISNCFSKMVMALRNLEKFECVQLLFHMLGIIIFSAISVVMGNLVSLWS